MITGKKLTIIFGLLSIIVLLPFTSIYVDIKHFFDHEASRIISPFLTIGNKISDRFNELTYIVKSRSKLEQERVQAVSECEEWKAKFVQLKQEVDFVDETDELVAFRKRYYPDNARLVRIIMRQISTQKSCLLINLGSSSGIEKDMIVVYKNCLLGRVTNVYPSYSQVTLITDYHSKITGECVTTHAQGICEGRGSSRAILNFVSHLESVEEGDLVISSGRGTIFPRGFALGRVGKIQQEGLYHLVDIEPLIDVTTITYCYVLDKL